jgi:hypothetical protein
MNIKFEDIQYYVYPFLLESLTKHYLFASKLIQVRFVSKTYLVMVVRELDFTVHSIQINE